MEVHVVEKHDVGQSLNEFRQGRLTHNIPLAIKLPEGFPRDVITALENLSTGYRGKYIHAARAIPETMALEDCRDLEVDSPPMPENLVISAAVMATKLQEGKNELHEPDGNTYKVGDWVITGWVISFWILDGKRDFLWQIAKVPISDAMAAHKKDPRRLGEWFLRKIVHGIDTEKANVARRHIEASKLARRLESTHETLCSI